MAVNILNDLKSDYFYQKKISTEFEKEIDEYLKNTNLFTTGLNFWLQLDGNCRQLTAIAGNKKNLNFFIIFCFYL